MSPGGAPDDTNGVVSGHLDIGLAGEFRDRIGGHEKSGEEEKQEGFHVEGRRGWDILKNAQPDCKFDAG